MFSFRGADQKVFHLTPDQQTYLKDQLTYDNPAYQNAKRFSRHGRVNLPPYLTYYQQGTQIVSGKRLTYVSVPSGVDLRRVFNLPDVDCEEAWCDCPVSFPPFVLELRPIQIEAESAYLYCQQDLYPRSLIQLPTSKGKTVLSLHIAATLGQKTLVLVHKDDLVTGWMKDIEKCFPDLRPGDIGLLKAKSRTVGRLITLATVQTLSRMSEDEFQTYTDQFGLVVQDECHHIGLNIFNVIGKFRSHYKLGLSATPFRSDGLNFVFELFLGGLCYQYRATQDDVDVLPVEVKVVQSPVKYRPFILDGQVYNYYSYTQNTPENLWPKSFRFLDQIPFSQRPLVSRFKADDEVVTSWDTMEIVKHIVFHEVADLGHNVLIMFSQKAHVDLYYYFLGNCYPDSMPGSLFQRYYGDAKETSEEMMDAAERGEKRVTLATYSKAKEGTNVKAWEVLILVSSIKDPKDVEQAVGRIRRSKEGKLNPVRVYDVSYPECRSLSTHLSSRMKVYRDLGFTILSDTPKDVSLPRRKIMFNRGFSD